jgi:quinol monooxygenase YgiN
VFCFYENWTSPELQAKHADTAHVQAFVSKMDELLEGGADGLTLHRVQRIA